MKAAWFEEFGPAADVLRTGEQPTPALETGQVLVRLETSGINPSDVKKRAGAFPDLLDDGLVIPHSDGAGFIEAVGQGVSESRVGERVWVYQAQYGRRCGTAARYVAIDSGRAVALPENTSFEVGACLGIIQWACQAGAKVIATACGADDQQSCLNAGADATVSHRDTDWAAAVLDANDGNAVDRVIDVEFGANLPEVLKVARLGATIATYSSTQVPEPRIPFLQMMYKDLTMRFVIVYAMPEEAKQKAIADINAKLSAGELIHRVAHVLPFPEIARAHELIESGGFRGCIVLSLS